MIRVACAVVFNEGKILVTQRAAHKSQPLLWEFPGGKIENGESPQDCIARELFEELKIYVQLKSSLKECLYDYGNYQINLIPFIADYLSGTITLSEHTNYKWMNPSELLNLEWAPADIPVVNEVLEFCKVNQR